jgi:hypothetical protein
MIVMAFASNIGFFKKFPHLFSRLCQLFGILAVNKEFAAIR